MLPMAMTLLRSTLPCNGRIRRYTLLLVGAEDDGVRGHAVLQIMLYVLAKDMEDEGVESTFRPHDYGPYSQQVADGLDALSRDGLVSHMPCKITLTPAGRAAARDAGRGLDETETAIVCECRRFFNDMTDEQLLLYMYQVYPDMAADSRVHDDIMARAEDIAMSMLKEGKISTGRTAEILKVGYSDVLDMAARRGIACLYYDQSED